MATDELPYARWLIDHFERDEQLRLCIPIRSILDVEQQVSAWLDDESKRAAVIDEILRLAHGIYKDRGETQLPKLLVTLVLRHPAGAALLEKSKAGKEWAKYGKATEKKAPPPHEPPPKGSIRPSAFYKKFNM